MNVKIDIVETLPNIDEINEEMRSMSAGAVAHFVGNIREMAGERKVLYIDFESYDEMAKEEILRITERLFGSYAIEQILFYHIKGRVLPGQTAVIACVSAPHREAAFQALMELMNELKRSVPIWKKEVYSDGHTWIAAHP